jgi:hypothetical protein
VEVRKVENKTIGFLFFFFFGISCGFYSSGLGENCTSIYYFWPRFLLVS